MATMEFEAIPVPLRKTDDGRIMIGRTRVPLDTVLYAFCQGETPEQIVESYTVLKLVDVYTIISYYLNHQPELDAYMERRERERKAHRQEIEARFPSDGLRERLKARLNKNA
jgi:uncharacterized protein (DUF433 family)